MSRFDARIFQDSLFWTRNAVRLVIREDTGRASRFLRSDGTWIEVAEGSAITDDLGITIPAEAVEAIARAVQEFQGHASHADTEARVLREWLTVEQRRVDKALER